jgi:hypothetical protein
MNLREISRRINKRPGSVSRVLPHLVERRYITSTRIGAKIVAYKLNKDNNTVKHLIEFHEKLEKDYDN